MRRVLSNDERGQYCHRRARRRTVRAKDTPRKLKALAEVGARPNQLFLTEVINLNDPQVQGPYFEKVIRWFRSTLSIIRPDARFAALFDWLAKDKEFAGFAGRVLHEASTGIAGVKVEDEEVPLLKGLFAR